VLLYSLDLHSGCLTKASCFHVAVEDEMWWMVRHPSAAAKLYKGTSTAAGADASVFHNDRSADGNTVLQSGEPVLPLLEDLLPLMWWSVDWVL